MHETVGLDRQRAVIGGEARADRQLGKAEIETVDDALVGVVA